jgi:hypothetical protein
VGRRLEEDARQLGCLDLLAHVRRNPRLQPYELQVGIADAVQNLVLGDVDERAQHVRRLHGILDLLARAVHRIDSFVRGQHAAVDVINSAATSGDLLVAEVLLLGFGGQPVVLLDLPVVEPGAQQRSEQEERRKYDHLSRPPFEGRRLGGRRDHAYFAGAARPSGVAAI